MQLSNLGSAYEREQVDATGLISHDYKPSAVGDCNVFDLPIAVKVSDWGQLRKRPERETNLKHYKPYIDRLRAMIREEKQGHMVAPVSQSRNSPSSQRETSPLREAEEQTTPTPKSAISLSSELEKLASFRASGVLTDEEFQQAKKRLLR